MSISLTRSSPSKLNNSIDIEEVLFFKLLDTIKNAVRPPTFAFLKSTKIGNLGWKNL